jgi:hypothetical protein
VPPEFVTQIKSPGSTPLMERRGRVLPFVWSRRRCPVRGASGRQGARARLPLPGQKNIRRRFAVIIVGRESDSVKATFALRVGQFGTSPLASAEHAALWIRLRHEPSGCRLRLQQRSLFRLFETIFRSWVTALLVEIRRWPIPFAFVTLALAVLYRCALAG